MIAEKLIELKILLRRACICESGEGNRKSTLSLRTKLLFLLKDRPRKAGELIGLLAVAKPNATALTNTLARDGLLTKKHCTGDRREVMLTLTDKGREYLAERFGTIEGGFKNILTEEDEYNKAEANIDEVIRLLSFLD